MSRGPGKWQRLILKQLDETAAFYVRGLLPQDATRSDKSAITRAATRLAKAGKIGLFYYLERERLRNGHYSAIPGGMVTVASRPDMDIHESIEVLEPGHMARRDAILATIGKS